MVEVNGYILITILILMVAQTYVALNSNGLLNFERGKEIENFNQCENLSMIDTTNCLNKFVRGIYKFNPTDDLNSLTLEELKEHGGDCKDYADLYKDLAIQLGYNAKTITFHGDDFGHRIAIIWNDELDAYCVVDQRNYDCHLLNPDEK